MKTAQKLRVWEILSAWIIIALFFVIAFWSIENPSELKLDSITILVLLMPAIIKFFSANILKDPEGAKVLYFVEVLKVIAYLFIIFILFQTTNLFANCYFAMFWGLILLLIGKILKIKTIHKIIRIRKRINLFY